MATIIRNDRTMHSTVLHFARNPLSKSSKNNLNRTFDQLGKDHPSYLVQSHFGYSHLHDILQTSQGPDTLDKIRILLHRFQHNLSRKNMATLLLQRSDYNETILSKAVVTGDADIVNIIASKVSNICGRRELARMLTTSEKCRFTSIPLVAKALFLHQYPIGKRQYTEKNMQLLECIFTLFKQAIPKEGTTAYRVQLLLSQKNLSLNLTDKQIKTTLSVEEILQMYRKKCEEKSSFLKDQATSSDCLRRIKKRTRALSSQQSFQGIKKNNIDTQEKKLRRK